MHRGRTNKQIYDELSQLVYGHDSAKKSLINLLRRSYNRYYNSIVVNNDTKIPAMNLLLVGSSGTGKTFLVETLANICDFPLIKLDATQLVPAGGNGGINVKDIKKQIIDNAKMLFETRKDRYNSVEGIIAQTVVFIDEIDKLAKAFESSGNWNRQIQATLLKLIEDNTELKGVSYIFAGAFSDMKLMTSVQKKAIGFFIEEQPAPTQANVDLHQALIRYGLMPELVGRIQAVRSLDKLSLEDYLYILKNNIFKEIEGIFRVLNILNYDTLSSEFEKIARKAFESGLGVRALRQQLLELTEDLEFNYDAAYEENVKCPAIS